MRRTGFCDGWEFSRNGGTFEEVSVPHDAMLGERRGPDAPAGSANGYFHGGVYRYRKAFTLSAGQVAGSLALEFEGVYRDARVHVNGAAAEVPPYGYIPFFVWLDGLVHEGDNLIEVEVDVTAQPDSRWYSGAGIYRAVWLWEGAREHIVPQGVRVTTLSLDPPRVRAEVEVEGAELSPDLDIRILDDMGREIGAGSGTLCEIGLPEAKTWHPDHPFLYDCAVTLQRDGAIIDEARVRFGIRTIGWGSEGLLINGESTKLAGGCIHHDNGPLGACSFPEAERRRVAKLKSLGFNALRMAHNPASGALLDACDELGIFVMEEAWDMWMMKKSAHDYATHFPDCFDSDLIAMVRRDCNHPSIIMYSIGNEVADPIRADGLDVERLMVDLLHALDPTRPVTCGFNITCMVMEKWGAGWYADADAGKSASEVAPDNNAPRGSLLFNMTTQAMGTGMELCTLAPGTDALVSPALDAVDIAGYNYAAPRYGMDLMRHPQRIIVGSETFPHHLPKNWRTVLRNPRLVGDFMWAAWDYLGEAGANAWCYSSEEAGFSKPWPWISAGSGCFDLIGNPGAQAALTSAVWGAADGPSIQVRPVTHANEKTYKGAWRGTDALPSWSWRGCEGRMAEVEVYDPKAAWIRLELNGRVLPSRTVTDCYAKFRVPYEPGELVAVASTIHGVAIGRAVLRSAEGALRIGIHPETEPRAGEICYVEIAIEGENGEVESAADELLTCEITGGELLAFASGDPAQTEPFATPQCHTHYGRALAIVRPSTDECTVSVRGETLTDVKYTLGKR